MDASDILGELKRDRGVKSKFKGVFRCGKKFKAQIQTNGVQHYLGLFETEEAAARAYDDHARTFLGPNAKTNFTYSSLNPLSSTLHVQSVVCQQQRGNERKRKVENDFSSTERKPAHPRRIYSGVKNLHLMRSSEGVVTNLAMQSHAMQQGVFPPNFMPPPGGEYPYGMQKVSENDHCKITAGAMLSLSVPRPQEATSNATQAPTPSFDDMISANVYYDDSRLKPAGHSLYIPSLYPSKQQGTENENSAPNDNPEEEDEVDWRLQIYYWVGKFEPDCQTPSCFRWSGCWLGSFVGRPLEEDFAVSSNAFEYTTDPISIENATRVDTTDGPLYIPVETVIHGYYMMENDSPGKLDKFLDKGIVMHFSQDEYKFKFSDVKEKVNSDGVFNVVGKGDSEFGEFFLSGTWDSKTKTLEMCRQYLLDTDIRADMDLDEYKQHLRLSGLPV